MWHEEGSFFIPMWLYPTELILFTKKTLGFPGGSEGKESACKAADLGSIPGWGRTPGEGSSYPLQYSCLENSMDRGALWATVHGVAESRIWLSNWHTHLITDEVKKCWWSIPMHGSTLQRCQSNKYLQCFHARLCAKRSTPGCLFYSSVQPQTQILLLTPPSYR